MSRRTVVLLTTVGLAVLTAAPAFAYWTLPVQVTATVAAGELAAPDRLTTRRGVEGDPAVVLVDWREPAVKGDQITPDAYIVERRRLDSSGRQDASAGWGPVPGADPDCAKGVCSARDRQGKNGFGYRVRLLAGKYWTSDPSDVRVSLILSAVESIPSSEPSSCADSGVRQEFRLPESLRTASLRAVALGLAVEGAVVQVQGLPDGDTWKSLGIVDSTHPVPVEAGDWTGDTRESVLLLCVSSLTDGGPTDGSPTDVVLLIDT